MKYVIISNVIIIMATKARPGHVILQLLVLDRNVQGKSNLTEIYYAKNP